MFIAIDERELDILRGVDHSLTALYLYMKQFVDFETGVLGYSRRISYQSMSEALYVEPRQGVKATTYSKPVIKRMVTQLIKLSLITKDRKDTLVFKLLFAQTDFSARKKAVRGTIPHPDTPSNQNNADNSNTCEAENQKADTPKKAKAVTPHLSPNNNTITTTTRQLQHCAELTGSSSDLIFPKPTDPKTREVMQKLIGGFDTETQQELLDEVQGYIDLKKVQSTPTALLKGLVDRCKLGSYTQNYAIKVKTTREAREKEQKASLEKKQAANVTTEQREQSRARGREAMSNVRQLLKKGG